ncbi:MAG: hypothetical protein EA383_06285 [Spirochaetaceae bacterium]|nr:MAG: hypothetical protein EA383_06285 [Spirochaetaceae bacterium]
MATISLEDSTGATISNPSEAQIGETLDRIGSGIDHCIINLPNDSFVQAAGEHNRLFVEYRDGSGMYSSAKRDFDTAAVTRIFADAIGDKDGWKTDYNFQPKEGDAGETAQARESRIRGMAGAASGAGKRFGSQMAGQARREISSEASYGVSRFIRNLIRSVFRGR